MIEITPEPDYRNFFNIQVLGNLSDNNQTTMTIYCQDHEFSTVEYSNELFAEVAKHVLSQRKGGQPYPIYVTDIDLSRNLFLESNIESLQSIHFLDYKKRIEKNSTALFNNRQSQTRVNYY